MNENERKLIELEGETIVETDEAVLSDFGRDGNVWVPKIQMEDWPDKGMFGEVLIEKWIAEEKDLL